jgi:hypothetical protein
MLILEVDGSQHADRTVQDGLRTAYLESLGYLVLRFWNIDVLQKTDDVLAHIYGVASGRRKAPSSGPPGHPGSRPGQALLLKGRRSVGAVEGAS